MVSASEWNRQLDHGDDARTEVSKASIHLPELSKLKVQHRWQITGLVHRRDAKG